MNPRMGLILVVALFVLSPLVAWFLHSGVIDWNSDGQGKNNGELIHPARPLTDITLQDMNGELIGNKQFEGLWTLLEFTAAGCAEACLGNIYKMRQIRLALGKDAHRAQRVVISVQQNGLDKAIVDNPGTNFYQLTAGNEQMLRQFPGYIEGDISSIAGRLYIVDPLTNLMMRYPATVEPSQVLKDLRQLLKATWIRPRD